ncbi:NAD-dependent epimerase/dehydratase family protein [Streptomyces sp. NPDC000983]|uniref:NAD-dependent epimerase/dehydratase family protein n=1 Tax=Streptomyces sp. NPDC000983 TaxID=3154373 RepID=UPI003332000A
MRDDNEVVAPAREGTLRVLRAARDAGARRTVVTSAFHAVGFGHGRIDHVFTEDDWSPLNGPGVDAYGRSKILAERAAWEFNRTEPGRTELTTICPVAVMGPVLGTGVSGANHIVQRILNGEMPGYPNMYIPVVDVRDVATAHISAMTAPEAAGERFLVTSGEPAISMKDIGGILRVRFGEAARHVPTRTIPNTVVRLAALFRPEFKPVAADLGYIKRVSNERTATLLGLKPRTTQEAIIASAESMITKSLVTI